MPKHFIWLIVLLGLIPLFLLLDCQQGEKLSGSSLVQESDSLGLENQSEVEEEVAENALTRTKTDNPILHKGLMLARVVSPDGHPLADANVQIHSFEDGLEIASYITGQEGVCAIDLGEASVVIVTIQHETTEGVMHGAHLLLRDDLSPTIPTDFVAGSRKASVVVLLKKANVPATDFAVDIRNDMEVLSTDVDRYGAAFFLIPPDGVHSILTHSRSRKSYVLVEVSLVSENPSIQVIDIPTGGVHVQLFYEGQDEIGLGGIPVVLSELPLLPRGFSVYSESNPEGLVEFYGMSPGRYMVAINLGRIELGQRKALRAPSRAEVFVGDGLSDVALEIGEAATIRVEVFSESNQRAYGEVFVRDLTVGSIVKLRRSIYATPLSEVKLQVPPGELEIVAWHPEGGWGSTRLTAFAGESAKVAVHLSLDEPSFIFNFSPSSILHPDTIILQDSQGSALCVWRRPDLEGMEINGKLIPNPLHKFDEDGNFVGLIPVRFEAVPKGEITVLSVVNHRIVETFQVSHWSETELDLMGQ